MELIEKKCPNCGASLEFGDNDKSCTCNYCHRSFIIEKNTTLDVENLADQFDLKELEKNMEAANKLLNKMMPKTTPFMIIFTIGIILIIGVVIIITIMEG